MPKSRPVLDHRPPTSTRPELTAADRPLSAQPVVDEVEAASIPYEGAAFWALALVGLVTLPFHVVPYLRSLAPRRTIRLRWT